MKLIENEVKLEFRDGSRLVPRHALLGGNLWRGRRLSGA